MAKTKRTIVQEIKEIQQTRDRFCKCSAKARQNGPSVWPGITGPAFFVSDLALYKSFKITETQNVQFRVSAFNFLNHPLPQLGQGQDVNLYMDSESGRNTNGTTNGGVQFKSPGQHRFMELALKYYF